MSLGQKIRSLREKHGLKQLNLANALQITPQAVSKWEREENLPDITQLLKLASLFDVTTDYLLGVTDAPTGVFDATVLSTGLSQFAQRAVVMSSRDVAEYTNVLFYHLTESVLKYDGVPVKYVGDGFLCFFSGADHADRALKATIHAHNTIHQQGLVMTLHSGSVYLGLIGHPDYATRDIVGETVNTAFLIMEWVAKHCRNGIGMTEEVERRLNSSFPVIRHPNVRVPLTRKKICVLSPQLSTAQNQ